MTSHRCVTQHNLTFNTIKYINMESDKEYCIILVFCFVFVKRKVLLMYTKLFVRHMIKIL